MKRKNSVYRTVLIIIAVVSILIVIALLLNNSNKPKEIALRGTMGETSLESLLISKGVEEIYVYGPTLFIRKTGSSYTSNQLKKGQADFSTRILSTEDLENTLRGAEKTIEKTGATFIKPTISYQSPANRQKWLSYVFPALSVLFLAFMVYFIIKQSKGGDIMKMNKSKAKLNTEVKVKFTDVAGAEEEKEELKEIVDFLKNSKKFESVGARVPKGVLLVGQPGTGKTLFAKAVAGEANVPFFSISGSDFVEMFVGTGAARVRDLFADAKKNMPCVVFIDEIDAVGRHRGAGLGGGNDEKEQTLNQLLVQMDGFENESGIIILAATNRPDVLDPALLRSGRFDRQIVIHPPDVKGREEILKIHARNKPIDSDVSFEILARMTTGFTGADLENILNEAAILAARAERKTINMENILEAINKLIAGPKKTSRVVTARDKKITAYHESGHAIVARILPNCDEVQEISIVPRGMAAGYTLTRPENDDNHVSKNKLLDTITMMLSGRAAEKIVIDDVTTGASNDIERATSIARQMVTEWGMSEKIGLMNLGGGKEVFLGKDYAVQNNSSDELLYSADMEVKKILTDCYKRALDILNEHRKIMDEMVELLFARETIYTNEVDMLFENKTAEQILQTL